MRKLFCVDQYDFDIAHVVTQLDSDLGLKLGHNPGNVVHGAVFGNHFGAGIKVSQEESRGKYWCNESPGIEEHTCVAIVLYEREEAPTYDPVSKHGHLTHLKPHPNLPKIHPRIQGSIDAMATKLSLRLHHHPIDERFERHLDFFLPHK